MISAITKQLDKRDEGFTLIELLVVVIIIGILAAIAIPVFLNQRQRAYERTAEADARNAAIAIESFFTSEQQYPTGATWTVGPNTLTLTSGGEEVVTVSSNVTLVYTLNATTNLYCIAATHALATATSPQAVYDSGTGGMTPNATCVSV